MHGTVPPVSPKVKPFNVPQLNYTTVHHVFKLHVIKVNSGQVYSCNAYANKLSIGMGSNVWLVLMGKYIEMGVVDVGRGILWWRRLVSVCRKCIARL